MIGHPVSRKSSIMPIRQSVTTDAEKDANNFGSPRWQSCNRCDRGGVNGRGGRKLKAIKDSEYSTAESRVHVGYQRRHRGIDYKEYLRWIGNAILVLSQE